MIQTLKNYLWHLPMAFVASLIYGFPSKKIKLIGITGTDGKTTTSTLIYNLLKNSGKRVALITTVEAIIANKKYDTGLHTTSPDKFVVQSMLKRMVDSNTEIAVLEVTAHAIDQFRFFGCFFDISVITNITREHLDYFHTMDNYTRTKEKIIKSSNLTLLNIDDPYCNQIYHRNPKSKILSYSIYSSSDYPVQNVSIKNNILSFDLKDINYQTDSPFKYQIYNIVPSIIIAQKYAVSQKIINQTLLPFPQISGRRQQIKNKFNINIFVDFAHTPNALRETIMSLLIEKPKNAILITIFGATGNRDPGKRPMMGRVVTDLSNITIITSDDTRNEDINDINYHIVKGIRKKHVFVKFDSSLNLNKIRQKSQKTHIYFTIPDRSVAIQLAVDIAQSGDRIVSCGKGHEKTILLNGVEHPWSDVKQLKKALKLKHA